LSDIGKAWKIIRHVARFWKDSVERFHHNARKTTILVMYTLLTRSNL